MNIKDHFCLRRNLFPAIALYRTQQLFGVAGPLGENLDSFSPLGYDIQTASDHKTQKIKLLSQSLKTLSEREKSDTWPSNDNDFKI